MWRVAALSGRRRLRARLAQELQAGLGRLVEIHAAVDLQDRQVAEQVETTGFFFKRCAYQAKDTLRIAPEILVGAVQWDKRPVMNSSEPADTWPIAWVVFAAVVISVSAAFFVFFRTRPTEFKLPDTPPDFGALEETESKEKTNDV